MDRIRIDRATPSVVRAPREPGPHTVAAVAIMLALLIVASIGFGVAVRAGIAPEFDGQLRLDAQHMLLIHDGPSRTCTPVPNPPQHDCFWLGPERREFSVDYVTPYGVRSLVWFELPAR